MDDVFQVVLTNEELQKVTGGSGPSASVQGGVFAQYAIDSNNYANAQFYGSASGYSNSASGSLSAGATYYYPQNILGYGGSATFSGN